MLPQLAQSEDKGQFYPQELGDSIALVLIPYPLLIFPFLFQLHRHRPVVHVYYRPLHALQHGVEPGEVVCQDSVAVTHQFTIHKRTDRLGHV